MLMGDWRLVVYGALLWVFFHVWVVAVEEPALEQTFGSEYEAFRAAVPRWIPRMTLPSVGNGNQAVPLVFLAIALSGALSAGPNRWTLAGPEGGVVSAIAADQQNPSTVYAATCGGVFKTIDGGANWRAINAGLPEIACYIGPGVLAVDPQNSGTVYVLSANQIFKSTDGGARWTATSTLKTTGGPEINNFGLRVLLIAASDPNTLYVSDGSTIFKSADGGDTWPQANPIPGPLLAIDPQNPDTLYSSGSGILKSTDGGISWNSLSSLPGVQALAIDPGSPDTLYAGCGSTNPASGFRPGGVFKSSDGGVSWNPASIGLPAPFAPPGFIQVLSLAINPLTPGAVYALIYQGAYNQGNNNNSFFLATSTDEAATWTLATDPNLSAANLHTIALDPQDAGTLYLGSSNGVLKTTDAGEHWDFANSGLRAVGVDLLIAGTTGSLFAFRYK
jgi:photosystem II stability/assembly factor-like uncharacterized protein